MDGVDDGLDEVNLSLMRRAVDFVDIMDDESDFVDLFDENIVAVVFGVMV